MSIASSFLTTTAAELQRVGRTDFYNIKLKIHDGNKNIYIGNISEFKLALTKAGLSFNRKSFLNHNILIFLDTSMPLYLFNLL